MQTEDTRTKPANEQIGEYLKEASGKNVLTSVVYRKKGQLRGRGDERKVYGDDRVSAVVITGFAYKRVVKKSQDLLVHVKANEIIDEAKDLGYELTFPDVQKALMALWQSFESTLTNVSKSNTDEVFDTLEVNGVKVPGCREYVGEGNPDNPKAPVPGTVYLQGLKIGETILDPAPNGPIPAPKSRLSTVAKNLIRKRLPVGRYVSYELSPERGFDIRVGDSAGMAADASGVTLRDEDLKEILELL